MFSRTQGIEETDEREDPITAELFSSESNRDIPPNIPPLPQSHLLHSRSPLEKPIGSVAKIVSQFQEAATLSNVIFVCISSSVCLSLCLPFFLCDVLVCI